MLGPLLGGVARAQLHRAVFGPENNRVGGSTLSHRRLLVPLCNGRYLDLLGLKTEFCLRRRGACGVLCAPISIGRHLHAIQYLLRLLVA